MPGLTTRVLVGALLLAGCGDDARAGDDDPVIRARPELAGEADAVLMVGDSLTFGARDFGDLEAGLRAAGFDEVEIIAEEGRDTSWAIEQVADLDAVPALVVVELGTNPGADPTDFDLVARTLVEELRARGAERISWVTPVHARDDRYDEKVEILEATEGIDLVADWASVVRDDPRELASDGLHPTVEGYAVLAAFLVDTAADLAGRR